MSRPAPPQIFDRARIRRLRERSVVHYPKYSFLKTRAANDLIERLADTPRIFDLALDLGSHTGPGAEALVRSEKASHILAADVSEAMARACAVPAFAADEERLPIADQSLDLVTSLLSLHGVNDLPGALVQIRRVLKPDGLFVGCLFGAGTLKELRTAIMQAEIDVTGGAAQRIAPLPGLQDMAGLLQRAGFALPVADVDRVTVRYDTPFDLIADIKGMGESAAFAETSRPPLSPRILARMAEVYAEQFADPDGRLRASFEIVWLSGWAPAPGQPQPLKPGSAKQSLARAVGSKEISLNEKPKKP